MFRSASRTTSLLRTRAPVVAARGTGPGGRRFVNTGNSSTGSGSSSGSGSEGKDKPRSWRNTTLRLGLAIGAVYYYNTSDVFSQLPSFSLRPQPQTTQDNDHDETSTTLPRLDYQVTPRSPEDPTKPLPPQPQPSDDADADADADQEAAFNPDTGEINWDCPCLGGMAHGPCGEEFKAAFSCFVYSTEEPKGMDCIDKFRGMQDCFRKFPDIYGPELDPDSEPEPEPEVVAEAEAEPASASASASQSQPQTQPVEGVTTETRFEGPSSSPADSRVRAKEARDVVKGNTLELPESENLVPKAYYSQEDESVAHATREK